jgi:hypothetical protein
MAATSYVFKRIAVINLERRLCTLAVLCTGPSDQRLSQSTVFSIPPPLPLVTLAPLTSERDTQASRRRPRARKAIILKPAVERYAVEKFEEFSIFTNCSVLASFRVF